MTRVIKADQVAQEPRAALLNLADLAEEARRVVLEARQEAARIVAEARARAEDELRLAAAKGREDGLAAGRAEGLAQGLQQAREQGHTAFEPQFREALALVRRIVEELAAYRGQWPSEAAGPVLELAMELAAKIVGEVAATDIQAARENLAKVLEAAAPSGKTTLYVNPAQVSLLTDYCRGLVEALGVGGPVRLAADATVRPGGVRLHTEQGEIDGTIETQLQRLAQAILGGSREYVSQAAPPRGAARPGPAKVETT